MPDCDKPQAPDQDTRKAIALTFAFLKRREIDQNAIAQRLGVGHQIISMVKTGKRSPSMRQVEMLSQLAHDALHAGTLDAEEFKLAEELTLAWWHAIHAQMQAVSALKQHVSGQLSTLMTAVNRQENAKKRHAAGRELGIPRTITGFEGILDTFVTYEANYGADESFEV